MFNLGSGTVSCHALPTSLKIWQRAPLPLSHLRNNWHEGLSDTSKQVCRWYLDQASICWPFVSENGLVQHVQYCRLCVSPLWWRRSWTARWTCVYWSFDIPNHPFYKELKVETVMFLRQWLRPFVSVKAVRILFSGFWTHFLFNF